MIHRVRSIRPNLHLEHGVRARPSGPLDSNPDASQVLSQPPVIDGKLNKLPHPLWRNLHGSAGVPPALCVQKNSVILKRVLALKDPCNQPPKPAHQGILNDAVAVLALADG